jgi:hypothetical protein
MFRSAQGAHGLSKRCGWKIVSLDPKCPAIGNYHTVRLQIHFRSKCSTGVFPGVFPGVYQMITGGQHEFAGLSKWFTGNVGMSSSHGWAAAAPAPARPPARPPPRPPASARPAARPATCPAARPPAGLLGWAAAPPAGLLRAQPFPAVSRLFCWPPTEFSSFKSALIFCQ